MKYERRTSKDITEDFLLELLKDRKVICNEDDFMDFFYPTKNNEIDTALLDNIDEACEMLYQHLANGDKIFLIVD